MNTFLSNTVDLSMGITGLDVYMKTVKELWKPFKFNCSLVIDGYAFLYYILETYADKFPCQYGGEYNDLRKKFKSFLDCLQTSCTLTFVFDGFDYDGILSH